MKQRLVIVILMTAFSLALCLFSLFYVRDTTDELAALRLTLEEQADAGQTDEAQATIARMLNEIQAHGRWLEILAPHDDLHEMRMQLTEAGTCLSIGDDDGYRESIRLFNELLDHLKTHEEPSLSNIL
ncbi:MAG: DUF4363 family protein [Clostridia bacterium]|nr:DUF4363 family protein [Clostridia bacterium]